ncbi:flocculation protein FLO11-like isoform X2 [Formica exsecta]|uniref:flocculation protein FLO11-like isoform X2 n=1 Tax=Formica exsecta TaxID=72781 RepID=UPI001142F810|nr:flocculation protein FLO11-like isoform X2 [Formica exsecta]
MQPLGVLLLLLTWQLVAPIPIFDRDGAGLHSGYRSAGFGETIRDWFRILKNRVVGKWQEWFGNDNPTPSFSPQDIFNIDKTIENRVSGYPGLFLDLFTGNNYSPDSDSDEWDMRPLMPNLPSPPMFGIDWTPNIYEFEIPKATQLPTTTPKIKLTTPRQQTSQTVTQTESVLTESTVTLTEPIPLITQLTATSTEPIATSTEEILTSTESIVTNARDESVTISTESILTSTTETITFSTESIVPSTESAVTSTESNISSIETMLNSTESIVTSIESTVIVTESIATSTEEIVTSTDTELPDRTSTDLILPVFNKKIEENETVNTRTTKKPRPASAEVIMF